MRWTRVRGRRLARARNGEIVWSWRSDAGAKLAGYDPQGDGGTKHRSPGRSRISRKTIAQGRPDDPPVPVVLPRAFCCTRTMGAVGTRPFPASSRHPMRTNGSRITRTHRAARTRSHAIRSLTI